MTVSDVDISLLEKLRENSVYDKSIDAKLNPAMPLKVDVNKAIDQYGLRNSEHIQWLRDAIVPGTTRIIDPNEL